jgi:NADPH-dependent 2,4-dienoyl-CoA reductase/sulfur reductase-like enzyme/nitrite reductase/ring-hydroxylating ferredoxin subunit
MADKEKHPTIDLTKGVAASSLSPGGMVRGQVGEDAVVLARVGDDYFAVGAHCTHYRGSLVKGLIVDDTVRCPLHHACFSLRTGEALRAPALDPIACWRVERSNDTLFVREKLSQPTRSQYATPQQQTPPSVIIVGGGAAGHAAADMIRRQGYEKPVTIISADEDPPVDRPNLSKDYLAGEAQDDWIPLWPSELYEERAVDLVLRRRVSMVDAASRTILLDDGSRREFGALLIATGADPVRPPVPGADGGQVMYLRSYADSRAIVKRAETAKHVVVVGASFIGLEVSSALRTRGIAVDVVAPDSMPLERVMGAEVGKFVRAVHESHGVVFHLGETVAAVDGRTVKLSGGSTLDADFVVIGAGVRPSTLLAEKSGLTLDRGIAVNEFLETSVPGVYAAGDVARWPDPHTGQRIRVEHWVVAQRQGQTAARNMLGARERFDAVPFFWSRHYDVAIKYVGHAERWNATQVDGHLDLPDWSVTYMLDGQKLAVATVARDRDNLAAELELERMSGA